MRRLPPFAELVAFEAVARHLSFTRAAEELCLTQSAVSHRVRRLEAHYGEPLILRLNPGLALTEAGAALLPQLGSTLDMLAGLAARPQRRLRVAAGTALSTWWLAGRLSRFMASRPGVSVDLVPVESAQAMVPDVDVGIHWVVDGEDEAGERQRPLFCEDVFPVCSPKLLPGGRPFAGPQQLQGMTLLHKSSQATGEWSWKVWLQRLGLDAHAHRGAQLRFADMSLVLSAACGGSGLALARSLLVRDALAAGRLAVPLAGIEPMVSTKKHVARWRKGREEDPDVQAFVAWLAGEAQATLAQTRALLPQ